MGVLHRRKSRRLSGIGTQLLILSFLGLSSSFQNSKSTISVSVVSYFINPKIKSVNGGWNKNLPAPQSSMDLYGARAS
jgi:hypothetical protein